MLHLNPYVVATSLAASACRSGRPVPDGTFRPEVISFGSDNLMRRRFDADGATSLVIIPLVRIDGRR